MSTSYAELPQAAQLEVMGVVAAAAAPAFGLDESSLELVAHEFNTTYAGATADGTRVALRINTNSASTPAMVRAQQAWAQAIRRDTSVLVPDPVPTLDGRWYVEATPPAGGRGFLVVAATWLDGSDVADGFDTAIARELGRTMATLHDHAAGWRPPSGAELPVFDDPLFGDTDALTGTPLLSGPDAELVVAALASTRDAYASVCSSQPAICVHADLHGYNLKWHDGRLAVFDFDDCGLAPPVVDLAVATFHLRGGDPSLETALRDGYAKVRSLPACPAETFEAILAARQLLLANSLASSSTAAWRAEAEAYLRVTVHRLRSWRETGRFTLERP